MKRYEADIECLMEHEPKREARHRFAVLVDTIGWARSYHPRGISKTCAGLREARERAAAVPSQYTPRIYERDSNGRPLWRRVK